MDMRTNFRGKFVCCVRISASRTIQSTIGGDKSVTSERVPSFKILSLRLGNMILPRREIAIASQRRHFAVRHAILENGLLPAVILTRR